MRLLGTHGEKHRVVFGQKLFRRDVSTDPDRRPKHDSHGEHALDVAVDDLSRQAEGRHRGAQHAPGALLLVVQRDFMTQASEIDGGGQSRRSRSDHRDSPAGGLSRLRMRALRAAVLLAGALESGDGCSAPELGSPAHGLARGGTDSSQHAW